MNDEQALAISSLVNSLSSDLNASERAATEVAAGLVVIPRHIDNAGSAVDLPQDLMQHGCMCFRPIPAAFQPPAIDEVSDQEECVARRAG